MLRPATVAVCWPAGTVMRRTTVAVVSRTDTTHAVGEAFEGAAASHLTTKPLGPGDAVNALGAAGTPGVDEI